MCSWLSFFDIDKSHDYNCLEFFAGVGRIARLSMLGGPQRVEKTKHTSGKSSCMDFSADAGFSFLDRLWFTFHLVFV